VGVNRAPDSAGQGCVCGCSPEPPAGPGWIHEISTTAFASLPGVRWSTCGCSPATPEILPPCYPKISCRGREAAGASCAIDGERKGRRAHKGLLRQYSPGAAPALTKPWPPMSPTEVPRVWCGSMQNLSAGSAETKGQAGERERPVIRWSYRSCSAIPRILLFHVA
jgi:hypothetical protein